MLSHASQKCLRILESLIKRLGVDMQSDTARAQSQNGRNVSNRTDSATQNHMSSSQYDLVPGSDGGYGGEPSFSAPYMDIDLDEIIKSFTWDFDAGVIDCGAGLLNTDSACVEQTGMGTSQHGAASQFDLLFGIDLQSHW